MKTRTTTVRSEAAFLLSAGTPVEAEFALTPPVQNAVAILRRDLVRCLTDQTPHGKILLRQAVGLAPEGYRIETAAGQLLVQAGDELGFVYALFFLSEHFLGVKPFWFWLEQQPEQAACAPVAVGTYCSQPPRVRWRGWFFNDEVLLTHWAPGGDAGLPWRMAFEALLRCGGNMVIPGTGKVALQHRQLAVEMGLVLTHHHAEPLGAELFAHAYPGETPDYLAEPQKFWALWERSVQAQKDLRVIWSVGFRGQGDCPFWSNDTTGRFATPEARGALIREVIDEQCRIVRKYVKDPLFCTNLYGEVMELAEQGCLDLPRDIIRVYADNGYGKMVARRRDNEQNRISALPHETDAPQGIYYHASFYDLQAAAHITMLPNSAGFVSRELDAVLEHGGDDYWLINCSNIRPHCFFLDLIRKKWLGLPVTEENHAAEYAADYYAGSTAAAQALTGYAASTLRYGPHEDEHAGEQFYTENTRLLAHAFVRWEPEGIRALWWLTGHCNFYEQAQKLHELCAQALPGMEQYAQRCREAAKTVPPQARELFCATVLMQAEVQLACAQGLALFTESLDACRREEFLQAFVLAGDGAAAFARADAVLQGSGKGIWSDFYANDCLADLSHTAYLVKKAMGTMRELGDNARHDQWHREILYSPADQGVFLQLVTEKHLTDEQLYQEIKQRRPNAAL